MKRCLLVLAACKQQALELDSRAWVSDDGTSQIVELGDKLFAIRHGVSFELTGACTPSKAERVVLSGDGKTALIFDWQAVRAGCVFDFDARTSRDIETAYPTLALPQRRSVSGFRIGEHTGWFYMDRAVFDPVSQATGQFSLGFCDLLETAGQVRTACSSEGVLSLVTFDTSRFPPTEIAREEVAISPALSTKWSRDGKRVAVWGSFNTTEVTPGLLFDVVTKQHHDLPGEIYALDFDVTGKQLAVLVQPQPYTTGGYILIFDLASGRPVQRGSRIDLPEDGVHSIRWLATGEIRISSYQRTRVISVSR